MMIRQICPFSGLASEANTNSEPWRIEKLETEHSIVLVLHSLTMVEEQVEELVSLVEDNSRSKYLILAVEDALVNFLEDDTSSDAELELEPMSSFNRMLVHRLADIFGFAHHSIGEGLDRHLVLECCPETSMPDTLVSDFLLESGESLSPMPFDVLKQKEVTLGQSIDGVSGGSLEARIADYVDEREGIFSNYSKKRRKKARRMVKECCGDCMVEELVSHVEDDILSKHLILVVEDAFVNFRNGDISSDAVLELEPMNSYKRMLVHRLAENFGFAHRSVGEEGEDRHLVLQCCPETSMPETLVSDLLEPGESQSSMAFDVVEVTPGRGIDGVGGCSSEERKTTYFAARERKFSGDSKKRPQQDPAAARRMVAHALGQPNSEVIEHDLSSSEHGQTENGVIKTPDVDDSSLETESIPAKHPSLSQQKNTLTLTEGGGSTDNSLRKEQIGAAKRLFSEALRVYPSDVECSETKKINC